MSRSSDQINVAVPPLLRPHAAPANPPRPPRRPSTQLSQRPPLVPIPRRLLRNRGGNRPARLGLGLGRPRIRLLSRQIRSSQTSRMQSSPISPSRKYPPGRWYASQPKHVLLDSRWLGVTGNLALSKEALFVLSVATVCAFVAPLLPTPYPNTGRIYKAHDKNRPHTCHRPETKHGRLRRHGYVLARIYRLPVAQWFE